MPTPGVAVTSLPTSMDAGINLTLICTIDLSQLSVDTGVDIITSWSMSGVNIVTSIISSVVVNETRLSGLVYMTTLPLGVLMLGSSDGEYTCEASIEPLPDSDYILFSARRSDLILVRATGEYFPLYLLYSVSALSTIAIGNITECLTTTTLT